MSKVKEWAKARKKLKLIYEDKGITSCEIKLVGCWRNNGLSFAHRKKRIEYYSCPEKLGEFNETLLACCNCHDKIENDKELTAKLFKQLR
jgi:hypothetical protein|tara:strand:- start:416 stop:685 length:270 start_codon:yes stop_codon:yes gene_type:complete